MSRPHLPLAIPLWFLLLLFVLRVLGQLLVVLGLGSFLPPMEEWYSGLLPYPFLLPTQVVIILLYGKVCLDYTRGRGFFAAPRRRLGSLLLVFGSVYLAVMLIRYILRMTLYPSERWTGGSIPIFLHWVLATFLLLVGRDHWRRGRPVIRRAPGWGWRAVRWTGALLVLLGVLAWIASQVAPSVLARRLGIRPAEFAVRTTKGVSFLTSDGVALVSEVHRPRRAQSPPTILVRIPLSRTLANRTFANLIGRLWAERGYTVVFQVTRGRPPSGGIHDPLRPERRDGLETLAWLAKQPWFYGPLGMWGGSYFGYTQWVLADQVNPGPSALLVQLCSTDFHGMFYPGGAFSLESALFWAVRSRGEQDETPSLETLRRGYEGFPLLEADDRAVGNIPFFDDWVIHRERDGYWAEIDGVERVRRLQAPALLMAGWFDPFLPTQLEDFRRIRQDARPEVAQASRLIIGPWAHAQTVTLPGGVTPRNYRLESLAPSVEWFDRHLRKARSDEPSSPVRIFVMGKNLWRDEQEWPLARTRYTPYYLRGRGDASGSKRNGALTPEPPVFEDPPDAFLYDPTRPVPSAGGTMLGPRAGIARQNEVEAREDVLLYTTPPLEENLEVTGPIRLVLYVSTTAPETDFTGKLVDVHPDDSAYNVSEGILRRGYSAADRKPASCATEITIELWPTSMVFLRGHRLRLEVSSSNYPRFDRNPNTGRAIATETQPIVARQSVCHGSKTPSRLILPVIAARKGAREKGL